MEERELSDKQRFWYGHIEACSEAGISMKAYAERHGLELQQFYFRKGELKKLGFVDGRHEQAASASFCSVTTGAGAPKADKEIRIQLANGILIEMPGDFNADALAALLKLAVQL